MRTAAWGAPIGLFLVAWYRRRRSRRLYRKMKRDLERAAAQIGEQLAPAFVKLAESMRDFTAEWKKLPR